ncbi:UPF0182 family protein [Lipingzhangella sp. LS1_29]|uniref:UPF0182 protein RIF23_19845 n=1 Tax=Lipingzhangella rawalii TaxID=2055835 RepID=A0ABU2HB40_9ACTN|nr:UPF0182 family protein [Lipingzhangella rawalii]MDS1272545.1 UPF0182 family protein [Lipingzhangella rawalii]
MSFRTPGAPNARSNRRSRLLAPVAAITVVIIAGIMLAANFWTDYKWFQSVGYTQVFTTELMARGIMFAAGAVVMAVVVGVNIYLAYRTRPAFRPFSLEQQGLDRYRESVDPHRKLFFWGIVAGLAVLTGATASGDWQPYLQFMNGAGFGVQDEQFGMDMSFFVFTYPFLRIILGYLLAALIIGFIAALITHYLYGGVRLQTQGQRTTDAARVHLSVLLGVFMLLQAARYYLNRYGLAFSERGYTTGPHYTDVNAVLPAMMILAVISIVCAALFFANIYFRNAMVPVASLGLLVLSAVLIGGVWPLLVQQFNVNPNEQRVEEEYIQRNIETTRYAYDLEDSEVTHYDAATDLSVQEVADESETIPNIRLIDPNVVSQTFQQTQQVRGFYQFPDVLDVDRYENEDGEKIDTVVAARELSGPPEDQDRWLTRHLIYTHGFGMVAAAGNELDVDGRPVFTEYDIPPRGELSDVAGEYEPRIYYGREGAEYVIVNAEPEYDRPADSGETDITTTEDEDAIDDGTNAENNDADEQSAPTDGNGADGDATDNGGQDADNGAEGAAEDVAEDEIDYHYDGDGGVQLSSFFDRLLYAVKYQEPQILLNNAIQDESRIIYDRDPLQRVEKVAPFLTVDRQPYPAVVDGDMVWIVDGYTTSSHLPYSTPIDLDAATTDAVTEGVGGVDALPANQVNYIRNSVKATVDAFDGSVTLYGWDDEDPVLETWENAFPDLTTSSEDISDELMDHLRYPDDIYKVQREMLQRYHITDAGEFYGGQDFWEIPDSPTTDADVQEPAYRQTLHYPGDDEARYSLTSTYVPRGRENLAAFMAVDSEPTSENYGTLRILQLPQGTAIRGPGQMQNEFQADSDVRDVLLPLQQGSEVTFGNLLTLPFGDGLLYVEPVYVQAEGGDQSSYPLLQQILVGYGEDVGIGTNLQEAINNLIGEGELEVGGTDEEATEEDAPETDIIESVDDALAEAEEAYQDGEDALAEGDFSGYGEAMQRLEDALQDAASAADNGDDEDTEDE